AVAFLAARGTRWGRGAEGQVGPGLRARGRIVALERETEDRRAFESTAIWCLAIFRSPPDQLTSLQQLAHQIGLPGSRATLHLLHPGAEDIRPRLDGDGVARVALEPELPRPSIVAGGAHGDLDPPRFVPGAVQDGRIEEIVALPENVGRDLEAITNLPLAGIAPVVDRRLNALDQNRRNPLLLHGVGPHRQRSTR